MPDRKPGPANAAGELSPVKRALLEIRTLRARLEELESARDRSSQSSESSGREPIAIVGAGMRFPGGVVDEASFWELLAQGRDAITEIPRERWDWRAYFNADADAPGSMYTRHGGFLDGVELFDAAFFGISPREAVAMDPQQRLVLEVGWEALENAGYAPSALQDSATGVFLGIANSDHGRSAMADPERIDAYTGSGNSLSMAAGRLSYVLGLHGPSLVIDTSCSSSLVAVHLACMSLRAGECSVALAGGANLVFSPESNIALSKAHMMARDGRCKTFDEAADGYVRSEGCCIIVLKKLADAMADGDRVLAAVRGSAVNHDGRSGGLTAPNGPAQAAVMRQALANAGVQPGQVSYIEAHGTGTALGDPIELQALGAVYGAARSANKPLMVASLKTNVGHLEAAAGIAGIIKTVLALEHRQIPPHLHLKRLTPHVRWDELRLSVPQKLTGWEASGDTRIAAVSSFGFSGTNAHVVIAEAPPSNAARSENGWPLQVLAVSAKSKTALQHLVGQYREYLEQHPAVDLRDFCFTANTGRSHFSRRVCFLAPNTETMKQRLAAFETAGMAVDQPGPSGDDQRVGFLFTGQGSQYAGMGRELYAGSPVFREAMERCAAAWKQVSGESLIEVLYPEEEAERMGAESRIQQARYAQPTLFAFEYALAELWRSWGIEPSVLLGHSLGEYVAAVIAGVFSLEDGLRLVHARARLMDTLTERGAMRTVRATAERVRKEIEGLDREVAIAAINGPESIVLSGAAEAVERVAKKLEAEGIRTQALAVTHGFHSPLLEPILDEFERIAEQVKYHAPQIRMISNLTGATAHGEEVATARYWRRHMRGTVRFHAGLQAALATGCRTLLEIGPQPHLITLGKSSHSDANLFWLPSARKGRNAWLDILSAVQTLYERGAEINWKALHGKSGRAIALPTYPFERQRYWFPKESVKTLRSPAAGSAQNSQEMSEADSISNSFYEVEWTPVQADPQQGLDIQGICLLCGGEDIVSSLSAALEKIGIRCAAIQPDEAGAADGEQDYGALLQAVSKQGSSPVSDFIYIAPVAIAPAVVEDVFRLSPDRLMEIEGNALGECLRIAQALLRMDLEKTPRLWIVTKGAQGPGLSNVPQSTLWGFGRSVAAEHPEMRVVRIDLDPSGEANADELLRCMGMAGSEDELALRGREIYVPRLRRVARDASGTEIAAGAEESILRLELVKAGTLEGIETVVARHIGGVVLCPAKPADSGGLRKDGAYLVTGGMSGIGLAVAEWLARRGAAQVIVMGRSPATADAETIFSRMRDAGTVVSVSQGDVAKEADVQAALDHAKSFPLRGVFHCAGVLDDGALLQQDWGRFRRALSPKLEGSCNLHRLTANSPLDCFVLFSSVASVFGSRGQTNYAAANSFLDAMAQYRHSHGLPALSINWGPWSETGAAVRHRVIERGSKTGLGGISTGDGLHALEMLLADSRAQVAVAPIYGNAHFTGGSSEPDRPLLRDLRMSRPGHAQAAASQKKQASWLPQLQDAAPAKRQDLLVRLLEEKAKATLGLSQAQEIDPAQPLQELGLDSLLSIELRNSLSAGLDRSLSAMLLFNYPTLNALAEFILGDVFADTTAGGPPQKPDGKVDAAPTNPVDDIETLSDEEADRLPGARATGRSIVELLGHLGAKNVALSLDGDALKCSAPQGVLTKELRKELRARKPEIIAFLRASREASRGAEPGIPRADRNGPLPLSFAQQRLWFLNQLDPNSSVYNIGLGLRISGPLDGSALERALAEIVHRHEDLRTNFILVDGAPRTVIGDGRNWLGRDWALEITDVRHLPDDGPDSELLKYANRAIAELFDFTRGPLFRAQLLVAGPDSHVLVLSMHHIISDGWSFGVLVREFAELYEAYTTGREPLLVPLTIQYVDFAAWQRKWLESGELDRQLPYWKKQLAGAPPVLGFPADHKRPQAEMFRGRRAKLVLPRPLAHGLKRLSHDRGVTLFMTLLAAFNVLLARYTGQDDIVVGSPSANRNRAELNQLIGFFVNNLVLRTDLSGNPSFTELLGRVREVTLRAYEHQDVPFDMLVHALGPERSLEHSPLFQVMFALQNFPLDEVRMAGLVTTPLEPEMEAVPFDLTVEVFPRHGELWVYFDYNSDLYEPGTIARIEQHYLAILNSVVADADRKIGSIPLLSGPERQKLLVEWNRTEAPIPAGVCFHQRFEEHARATPDRKAVIAGEHSLTYGELEERANRIAACLESRGAGPEKLVALCLERSADLVAAILGIAKSGAAYIPLDPAYPKGRTANIFEDAKPLVVLTARHLLPALPNIGMEVICLDDLNVPDEVPGLPFMRDARPSSEPVQQEKVQQENLAYVIFTSGSTGWPKGVQITHRALVNFLESMSREPGLSSEDVLLAVTTVSFDIAALELLLPLYTGATVCIALQPSDPMELLADIERYRPTVMQATPATWKLLIAAGWKGNPRLTILCGGEALDTDLARSLLVRSGSLWNMYGPTETTIWSAALHVEEAGTSAIPVGRPICNTQFYVLDGLGQPAPQGVAGELWIGGEGLARGYLGRPELTSERFIQSPFSGPDSGARLYRTGDLVRYRTDGTLDFLGRMDHQIKLRGFRIELGEIENALRNCPGVHDAVTLLREDNGEKRLVGYLACAESEPPSDSAVRDHLRATLPEYMVPGAFVFLKEFPRLPNGKLDRAALPAPKRAAGEGKSVFAAPATSLQQTVAAVFRNVLSIEQVGLDDNFFDLGAHSLQIVKVHGELNRSIDREIPLISFFQYPTIRSLTGFIEQRSRNEASTIAE